MSDGLETIRTMASTPRYPSGGVLYLHRGVLEQLGEQIAVIAIAQQCDENGLRIACVGAMEELPDIAKAAIERWLHCEVRVLG